MLSDTGNVLSGTGNVLSGTGNVFSGIGNVIPGCLVLEMRSLIYDNVLTLMILHKKLIAITNYY